MNRTRKQHLSLRAHCNLFIGCLACTGLALAGATMADDDDFIEALPEELEASIADRDERLGDALPEPAGGKSFIIERTKTWLPGATVRVAFQGGDAHLRQKIEKVARAWSDSANLQLDFRNPDGTFRQWTSSDTEASAEIRVSFDQKGYWSLVGTDAMDPAIVCPGRPTLNLAWFDRKLPDNWQGKVLHEFGHALGFLHEHQRPYQGCKTAYRWDDDPGYEKTEDLEGRFIEHRRKRPGIYTRLSGFPNYWSKAKIDHNLASLPDSFAYVLGREFDKYSIMKYGFPEWMCQKPGDACCALYNHTLSEEDKNGARLLYPEGVVAIRKVIEERIEFLQAVVAAEIPAPAKKHYQKRLAAARQKLEEIR